MKKIIGLLLLIGILGLLTGCQNDSENSGARNSETLNSETNTETENQVSVDTSNYELTELDLDSLSAESITVLDMTVFDTNVYAVLKVVGESDVIESDDNPYLFIAFDTNGSIISSTPLETPRIEGDVCMLKQFTIGQDGNIYALKVDYVDTSSNADEPKFEDGLKLVSWDTDGSLISETPLKGINDEAYADVFVRSFTVSSKGDITLCCKHLNGAHFMASINADGTINTIFEDELRSYTTTHFKENNDGSLYSIRVDATNAYFISYEGNIKNFSEEITLPKVFDFMTCLSGKNSDSIYYFDDEGIHNYNLSTKETNLVIDFAHTNVTTETIQSLVPINETDYICTYTNGSTDGILRIGFLKMLK